MTRLGGTWMLAVLLLMPAMEAAAQPPGGAGNLSIYGGAGWMSLWDDETFLGRGPLVSGGAAVLIAGRLVAEGEVAWADHHRDSGYLAADGTPFIGTVRLSYAFRSPTARVRPFAGVGLSILHSTGYLTTRSVVRGPDGRPLEGPPARRDWSLTEPGMELGTGVTIKTGRRTFVRPAFRWTSSTTESRPRNLLEPPLWIPRADVIVGWTLGD